MSDQAQINQLREAIRSNTVKMLIKCWLKNRELCIKMLQQLAAKRDSSKILTLMSYFEEEMQELEKDNKNSAQIKAVKGLIKCLKELYHFISQAKIKSHAFQTFNHTIRKAQEVRSFQNSQYSNNKRMWQQQQVEEQKTMLLTSMNDDEYEQQKQREKYLKSKNE